MCGVDGLSWWWWCGWEWAGLLPLILQLLSHTADLPLVCCYAVHAYLPACLSTHLSTILPGAGDDEGLVKLWDSRQSDAVVTLEAHSGETIRQCLYESEGRGCGATDPTAFQPLTLSTAAVALTLLTWHPSLCSHSLTALTRLCPFLLLSCRPCC